MMLRLMFSYNLDYRVVQKDLDWIVADTAITYISLSYVTLLTYHHQMFEVYLYPG